MYLLNLPLYMFFRGYRECFWPLLVDQFVSVNFMLCVTCEVGIHSLNHPPLLTLLLRLSAFSVATVGRAYFVRVFQSVF
jgi:hypothetical protein